MTDTAWAERRLRSKLARIRGEDPSSPTFEAQKGSTMNQITRQVILEAHKHVGVRETGGPNRGPEIDRWLFRVGSVPGQPWCAAFASCMLADAFKALGLPLTVRLSASAHTLLERCQQAGGRAAEPGPGFLFGIDHGLGQQGQKRGHCGIVVDVNPDGVHMTTIEGNTDRAGSREGQGVYQLTRRIDEATLGFADPALLGHG